MKSTTLKASLFLLACIFTVSCSQETEFYSTKLSSSGDGDGGDGGAAISSSGDGDGGDGGAAITSSNDSRYLNEIAHIVGASDKPSSVEIVWIVDESRSMKNETQIVKDNLAAFNSELANITDIRSYLSTEHQWVVGSRNGPQLFLIGLKKYQLPQGGGMGPVLDGTNGPKDISSFYGQAKGSRKIVVFVTDDNSDMKADTFLNAISDSLPDLKVFAFVGENETSCPTLARPGLNYIELAKTTGGEIFNLCAENWQPHFERLFEKIQTIILNDIVLDIPEDAAIVKVLVKDKALKESDFQFANGILSIKEGIVASGDRVIVKYSAAD